MNHIIPIKAEDYNEKGFIVKEGSIQDATFITSDPGQKRNKEEKASKCKKANPESESIRMNQVQELDKVLVVI